MRYRFFYGLQWIWGIVFLPVGLALLFQVSLGRKKAFWEDRAADFYFWPLTKTRGM